MNKHSLSFTLVLLAILLVVLSVLLWKFSLVEFFPTNFTQDENNSSNLTKNQNLSWINKVANFEETDYVLPRNLIDIRFENQNLTNLTKTYQLIIDNCNEYSVFCLRQTMDKFGTKFTLIKENGTDLIYINLDEKSLIYDIINELKKYDIHSKAKEL